jgi:hypothetical protein
MCIGLATDCVTYVRPSLFHLGLSVFDFVISQQASGMDTTASLSRLMNDESH